MRLLALILFPASIAFAADTAQLVNDLMRDEGELAGVPFAEVVQAATGKRVIALNPTNAVDRELLSKISRAMDEVMRKLNAPDSPVRSKRRINEVSTLFETTMKAELNAIEGLECDFPKLANGARQRSGYPDLRLADKRSGRVLYLDPKLMERGSRASSLRTFYYEPKRETNKILDDAHHLIVGFTHDGQTGAWQFLGWELVDLAHFRVKLKAEFQANNRDLYRPEAVVGASTNAPAAAK
jgi:hypothetical protein